MNKRQRTIGIFVLALLVMTGMPTVLLWRQFHQEQHNHALIAAIKAQNRQRVLELLDEGADANTHDTGIVPSFSQMLHRLFDQFGRHGGKAEAVYHPSALLLAYGTIDGAHPSCLPDPTSLPDEEIVLALLDHNANPNDAEPKADGCSAVGLALAYYQPRILRRLLQCGANPNAVAARDTVSGRPIMEMGPLMLALDRGDAEAEKLLIEYGADVNVTNSNGATPLMLVATRADPGIVLLMLQHGANPEARDNHGLTALSFASRNHLPEDKANTRKIVALLKRYGATR